MTGQVEFDSHISDTVVLAADLVNALTPGESAGRPYSVPPGEQAIARVEEAVRRAGWAVRLTAEDAGEFAEVAARLRAVFVAVHDDDVNLAASVLNELMTTWSARPTLSRHDNEPWHLHFHPADANEVEGTAAGMATGMAFVVGSEYADRLGLCSAQACDRVYVDTSRNGTKRFCTTACQNRVKAAAFRARRAGAVQH